jgi:ABC-type uncharacterized transport system substrate-binding protein
MKEWSDGVVELWSVGNRQFVVSKKILCLALCAMLSALCFSAEAQQAKVPRIGFLGVTYASTNAARIEAFRQGLRELGYTERKNIVIEYRWAEGKAEKLPDLADELVRLKVDVIVTAGPAATRSGSTGNFYDSDCHGVR